MKIEISTTSVKDRELLLHRLRELAGAAEITAITFDPGDETPLVAQLIAAGYPADRIIEERRPAKTTKTAPRPQARWPHVQPVTA